MGAQCLMRQPTNKEAQMATKAKAKKSAAKKAAKRPAKGKAATNDKLLAAARKVLPLPRTSLAGSCSPTTYLTPVRAKE